MKTGRGTLSWRSLAAPETFLYNFVNCHGWLFTFIVMKATQLNCEKLPSIYTEALPTELSSRSHWNTRRSLSMERCHQDLKRRTKHRNYRSAQAQCIQYCFSIITKTVDSCSHSNISAHIWRWHGYKDPTEARRMKQTFGLLYKPSHGPFLKRMSSIAISLRSDGPRMASNIICQNTNCVTAWIKNWMKLA